MKSFTRYAFFFLILSCYPCYLGPSCYTVVFILSDGLFRSYFFMLSGSQRCVSTLVFILSLYEDTFNCHSDVIFPSFIVGFIVFLPFGLSILSDCFLLVINILFVVLL